MSVHAHLTRLAAAGALVLPLLSMSGCGSGDVHAAAPVADVTAILVHGAWADGSSWSRITPLLQSRGIKVMAVQLNRNSLREDALIVRRAIEAQTGKVVLVGHSYGGSVITEAGGDGKVGALVYVAAFAPGDGESISDLISPYPPGAWQAGLVADSAGYLRLDPGTYATYFASDLPKAEAAVLASSQGPLLGSVLQDKVTNAAWKTKASYWALSSKDQMIPAALQQGEAVRINARVTTIDGGHTELLSHPKEVAAVILDAVDHLQ